MDIHTAISEFQRTGLNVEINQSDPKGIHSETIVGEDGDGYRFYIFFRDGSWTAGISLENFTPGYEDCKSQFQTLDEATEFVTAFLGPQKPFGTDSFSKADAVKQLKQDGLSGTFNNPRGDGLWGGMGPLHPILKSVFMRDGKFFNYYSVHLKGSFYVVLIYNESHPVAKLLTFTKSLSEAIEAICDYYKSWIPDSENTQG